MTDDEHEKNLEQIYAALLSQLRAMHADDDSDAFEEFAVSISVFCGTIVTNLNALAGDRAGVAVMSEVDDRNIGAVATAITSIIVQAFQLMKRGVDD